MDIINITAAAKATIFLDRRTKMVNGEFPVKLIVYFDGTNKRYALPKKISFTEAQWQKINSQRLKQDSLCGIKDYLASEKERALKIIRSLGHDFSYELFEAFYLNNKQPKARNRHTIYSLFEEYIKELRTDERIGTASSYATAMKSLQAFSPELPIQEITPKFFERYEKWMLEKNCSITTVGIYLRSFRAIINIAKEKMLFSDKTYPFGKRSQKKYEIPEGKNIKKALPMDDIYKIMEFECDSQEKKFARDMWLFSFYGNGMNMKDIFNLKYRDINSSFFYFNRLKTIRTRRKLEPIGVFISKPIATIIEEWGNGDKSPGNFIFDVFSSSMTDEELFYKEQSVIRRINSYMKDIGKQLGISAKLTTYVARHSWATIVRNLGTSVEEISEGLGHSNILTTKKYLDSFPKEYKEKTAKKLISIFDAYSSKSQTLKLK